MVVVVVVVLQSVTRSSPWLLALVGAAAVALFIAGRDSVSARVDFVARMNRADRLAPWIVLVCLTVIGYLHNANTWSPDGAGFVRPALGT